MGVGFELALGLDELLSGGVGLVGGLEAGTGGIGIGNGGLRVGDDGVRLGAVECPALGDAWRWGWSA